MAGEIDLQKVALRIAHRIRAIAIREKLVPVGKPDPDSGKRTGGEGKYFFAKKVFQPARKGKPFFRSAADLFEQNLDKEIAGIALDDELARYLAANLRKQGVDVKV